MRRFVCAILAFLLAVVFLLPLSAAEPQHAEIARITQAVRETVGTDTPGAAVVVFESGERILYEGYGYADIAARTLVTAETAFELGELSSLFVALAMQKLVEQQKLEWDKDIAYYLPADFVKELDLAHEITPRDLLSGRAGFADRYVDLRYEDESLVFEGLEEALLAEIPVQNQKAGDFYAFSRYEITLAAFLVECISGTDYASFVNEQILQPLGMTHTVLAPHVQVPEMMAAGHVDKGDGYFAVAEAAGRSYSALWPADGAVSNAADLSLLLRFLLNDTEGQTVLSPASRREALATALENGVFQTGMAGLSVSGSVRGVTAVTAHFSASLCIDFENRKAALVLANTENTALTKISYAYCGFVNGVTGLGAEGTLPDVAQFEGEYILRSKVSDDLFGRRVENVTVNAEDDGTIYFGAVHLVQIAPGIFADLAHKDIAVLQFFTDVEGEVTGVVCATGESYRPADLMETEAVSVILYVLLIAGAVYFLLGGILALADALLSRMRNDEHPRAWRFTVPWVLAALNAIVVLVQVLVCANFGAGAIASFFTATGTISLVMTIGASCGFVYALFTGFTVKDMTGRVARNAIFYVLFSIVCGYWGVLLL